MTTFPRILVATDFSDHARHAFEYADNFAKRHGGALDVVHVLPTGHTLALHAKHEDDADKRLQDFLSTVDQDRVASATWKKATSEEQGILAEAQAHESDLIVLGTRGRSAFVGMFLGSVATKVIQHSHRPVLTVPDRISGPLALKRVLCAVDFSDRSNEAMAVACELTAPDAAQLLMIHAVPLFYPPVYGAPAIGFTNYQAESEKYAEEAMGKLLASLGDAGERATGHVVVGRPSEVISRLAGEEKCDLVVMGSRTLSGLDHALIGSTAERVARSCPCPVLCIKTSQADNA